MNKSDELAADLADRLEQEGHFELYRGESGDDRTSKQVWLREDERDVIVSALRLLARYSITKRTEG
jgi:hypothetical protein